MKSNYKRISLSERVFIEESLNKRVSARKIADHLERSNSSICDEVKTNKSMATGKYKGQQGNIDITKIPRGNICPNLLKWPYVCNGCNKRHYHCHRPIKVEYDANAANAISKKLHTEARKGVNANEKEFLKVIEIIRRDLRRNLSPYAISQLHSELNISPSTIYRWAKNGYGDLTVMDLQKQVKYKPRIKRQKMPTKHGYKHSYKALCELGEDINSLVCEMDTVIGRKLDKKCILTLYLRNCKLQISLLLNNCSCEEVNTQFNKLEQYLGTENFNRLFGYILTDNGIEFCDYNLLEKSCNDTRNANKRTNKAIKRTSIFYCDICSSNQKGGCEKNHVEIRKVIPKRRGIVFDRLTVKDIEYINSQVNSTPRKSLNGLTPIKMFKLLYGDLAEKLLTFLNIKKLDKNKLNLTLNGINNNRIKRGLCRLND